MKKNDPKTSVHRLEELVLKAQKIGRQSLEDASKNDSIHLFPEKTLEEIISAKLLTAALPSKYGGLNLGLIKGSNLAMLKILKHIGSGNLVMGRVLEGHINAQLLIHQFGTKKQQQHFAKEAFNNHLFGVWNTQANDGTHFRFTKKGKIHLNGSKIFATGIDYVSRPIITGARPDASWQMAVVPLDEIETKVDNSWWNPMGMRASRSYKITFNDSQIQMKNLLGKPGNYYEQPSFSGGAVRFAAIQLGGAEMLFDETRKYLQNLGRIDDAYQKMRLGQMAIAIATGNQWLESSAEKMDCYWSVPSIENREKLLAHVNMMRTAIENICTEVMSLCQKSVGARGLNKPFHFERIIRDLCTYLRQPAPDMSLADVGKYVLENKIPANDLWEMSTKNKK